MQTSRRAFFKVGLAGAAVLAAGGAAYRWHSAPAASPGFRLSPAGQAMLTALVPALAGPMLPAEPLARAAAVAATVERVRHAILGLPLATQREVQDLFGLLTLAPTRRLLAGVPPWPQARPDQVAAFLDSWRKHRLGLLQSGYHALHDLVLAGWYADPATWGAIGYPGPLKELS
ncbi:hypothetical protein [Massilia sp. erpn]|uniref:hypothetical protein n=1 Tax=Massilia sp. erpn TaxID=2738142 RepID=UPI0021049B5A|nr:hypothetical protein [Massilia sp. erpn]UTY60344.1 hypothetical protein HPQ68_26025 [Massilia sp. erpn]